MARKPAIQTPACESEGSKSARTRERILDAAAHVLSRQSYAGARLTNVADQAQLQAPAVYYYFHSRDDLIEEVMWTGISRMRDHLNDVLATPPRPRRFATPGKCRRPSRSGTRRKPRSTAMSGAN